MAWVKVTSHGGNRVFLVNTDKLALIERREGGSYTTLIEPGEGGETYKVKETPEEIVVDAWHWEREIRGIEE